MRYPEFKSRVLQEADSWFPKPPSKDANARRAHAEGGRQLAFTIGSAELKDGGVFIAIARCMQLPSEQAQWDENLQAEARHTKWQIATSPNDLYDEDTFYRAGVNSIQESAQLTRLQVGHIALLPKDAAIITSTDRSFFPTLVAPDTGPGLDPGSTMHYENTRYQIVVPRGGIAEI